MAKAKQASVKYGTLTEPLHTYRVRAGTTLIAFLEARDIQYTSAIRVNGKVAARTAKLVDGDIITSTEAVSGGR